MKKLILSAAVLGLSSTAAFAASDGLYVGGQLGYGDLGYNSSHAFIPMANMSTPYTYNAHTGINVDSTGIAGRLFGGFQFSQNLAAEVGYSLFSHAKATLQNSINSDISTQAVDAVGKLIYPVSNTGLNIYAKAGLAWVFANQDLTANFGNNTYISSSTDPIRPVFGLGAGYDVMQNLTLDASVTRIQGNNNIQNIDFYGAGLTYHFS